MKLAIITPTRNRLFTLALLHQYISRQTRKADMWIIATDGDAPDFSESPVNILISQAEYAGSPVKSFTGNLMRAVTAAEANGADAVLIMEDDDWYAPDYVAKMEETLAQAEVIGNKPTASMNIVSGSVKNVQHDYIVLAQLGFARNQFDLFKTAAAECRSKNENKVDKTFFALAQEQNVCCGTLLEPHLYVGLKGIYDMGSKTPQGFTEQHRRHKKYFKGHFLRLLYVFNKNKKSSHEQIVYKKLCHQIGEKDAAVYRKIVEGAKQDDWES